MVLIGMLHHRKNPEKVQKTYAYAAVSKAEGAELLYFSPKMVNFDNKTIKGYMYKNGKWMRVTSRFPDVIYNAGSPVKLNRSKEILEKLKSIIPFTTHSIGNKLQVYNQLLKDGEFSSYLIPTVRVNKIDTLLDLLKKYKNIIFKPIDGHKGDDILYIELNHSIYKIYKEDSIQLYNERQLVEHVGKKLDKGSYIAQPYIHSKTKLGLAYDFRLHTQKNGEGNWVITAIYPRIGKAGSIVTNINKGGSTNYAEPFLKHEFNDSEEIKNQLEKFALGLSKKMDEIQKNTYNETLDELGIDIGIDPEEKFWIYEINWRPGCPPAFYLELDVVKNMIHYAMFLAKKNSSLK